MNNTHAKNGTNKTCERIWRETNIEWRKHHAIDPYQN